MSKKEYSEILLGKIDKEDIGVLEKKGLRACLETHLSIMKRFSSMLAMAI